MAKQSVPIERRALSPEQFIRDYVAHKRPVVITNALDDCPAMKLWDPDYLKAMCGKMMVNASVRTGKGREITTDYTDVNMEFAEFLDRIYQVDSTEEYHLGFKNFRDFQSIIKDISVMRYQPTDEMVFSSVWFGSKNGVADTHYDTEDNLLCQIRGRKQIELFGEGLHDLYPRPILSSWPNLSKVNTTAPNLEAYPRFQNVTRYECVLEPGDVLYIPIFWWHRITYLEPSLSVSHWWAPSFSDAWDFKRVRSIPWNIRNHCLAEFAKPMIPQPLRRIAQKLRAPATR